MPRGFSAQFRKGSNLEPWLEQSLAPFQITESSNVGQGERKTIPVFIARGRGQEEATIFKAHATAIPVVGSLAGCILQEIEFGVNARVDGRAPSLFGGAAVAQKGPRLVKLQGHAAQRLVKASRDARRNRSAVCRINNDLARTKRNLQISVAGLDKKGAAEMHSRVKRAGVDASLLGVVIKLPVQAAGAAGAHAQPGNNGSEAPRIGQKGDAGEVYRRGQDVPRPIDDGAAKIGVQEILLLHLPAQKLIRAGRNAVGATGTRECRACRRFALAAVLFAL